MNNQLSVKKHPLYKDSGVEWLGDVPEHWGLSRIKQKGTVRGRVGWKALKADEYVDEGYIFLSTPNIKEKDIDFANVNYITYERYIESPEIMIQEGDILLTKDGSTLGTTNIVSLLPREATVNSSIAVVRFNKDIFKKYIYYQILSEFIQNKIHLKKSGMGVPHLFQRDINNFFILIPSLSEQKAIADYLDTKTAQIDRKIDLLSQKAKLYSNLKQSLINETVTRGLDKSVPMKDSGIEWIGEVPKHWELGRAKSLFKKEARSIFPDDDIVTVFRDGEVTLRKNRRITGFTIALHEHGYQGIRKGDLVIHAMDAFAGAVGVSDSDGKASPVYSAYTPINFNKIYTPYYGFLIRQMALSGFINSFAKGIRERSTEFRHREFAPLTLIVPPFSEQKAIADYLDTKTAQIDQIIQTINAQIEKFKELRKTLINDVVTGKIKVI
jgi:type I restriction enzyme S subunit